ncbi:uncharacterized protein BJ212DRAFT_1301688 [Suillus subaureus]|uniref:Uncharacterized protein n=1 Tax=Suillus subaureus TaxID=48587 RepID=A0A9P7E6K4_9AGAM|nr:uncharacterized protein BJ212DRAFT_1301688 [Suillus subaureus]KAG1812180.1 hypothetical protein BJ212DRAFT_1301688 [Suillus subaureus]
MQHSRHLLRPIGIGKSIFQGVVEKPKGFWTVDLFMDKLGNLLVRFGWTVRVYHYGYAEVMVVSGSDLHNHSSTLLANGVIEEAQDVCIGFFFYRIPHVKRARLSQRRILFLGRIRQDIFK